jgi:hypothetical protein
MTANQIANFVMSQAHELQSFADMIFTRDNEDFQHIFKNNDKFYIVTFSYDFVNKLNIFERNSEKDTDSEHMVAKEVEYTVIAAYDENGNLLWSIDEEE